MKRPRIKDKMLKLKLSDKQLEDQAKRMAKRFGIDPVELGMNNTEDIEHEEIKPFPKQYIDKHED